MSPLNFSFHPAKAIQVRFGSLVENRFHSSFWVTCLVLDDVEAGAGVYPMSCYVLTILVYDSTGVWVNQVVA